MFAVVITGPPGAGKTSVLTALADALRADDARHAAVEAELLAWAHPALSAEQRRWHLETTCELYRAAGHRLLLVAHTIESDEALAELLAAVGADEHLVVRLEAEPATLVRRITDREPAGWSGLSELVGHARVLAASMAALRGVDLVVSTERQRPEAVAEHVRAARPDVLGRPVCVRMTGRRSD